MFFINFIFISFIMFFSFLSNMIADVFLQVWFQISLSVKFFFCSHIQCSDSDLLAKVTLDKTHLHSTFPSVTARKLNISFVF